MDRVSWRNDVNEKCPVSVSESACLRDSATGLERLIDITSQACSRSGNLTKRLRLSGASPLALPLKHIPTSEI